MAPLLANWFVAKVENNILQQSLPYAPTLYKGYVDDILALFRTTDDRDRLYDVLNSIICGLQHLYHTWVSIDNSSLKWKQLTPESSSVMPHPDGNVRSSNPFYAISSSYLLFMTEVERIKANLIENPNPEEVKNVKQIVQLHGIDDLHFKIAPPATSQKSAEKSSDYILIPYVGKTIVAFSE